MSRWLLLRCEVNFLYTGAQHVCVLYVARRAFLVCGEARLGRARMVQQRTSWLCRVASLLALGPLAVSSAALRGDEDQKDRKMAGQCYPKGELDWTSQPEKGGILLNGKQFQIKGKTYTTHTLRTSLSATALFHRKSCAGPLGVRGSGGGGCAISGVDVYVVTVNRGDDPITPLSRAHPSPEHTHRVVSLPC